MTNCIYNETSGETFKWPLSTKAKTQVKAAAIQVIVQTPRTIVNVDQNLLMGKSKKSLQKAKKSYKVLQHKSHRLKKQILHLQKKKTSSKKNNKEVSKKQKTKQKETKETKEIKKTKKTKKIVPSKSIKLLQRIIRKNKPRFQKIQKKLGLALKEIILQEKNNRIYINKLTKN